MADALLETTIAARGKLDALDLLSLSLRLGVQVDNLQQRLAQALLADGDPGMPPGELLAAQRLLRAVSPEMQMWAQAQLAQLPPVAAFSAWHKAWFTAAYDGHFIEALRVYLLEHPGMRLLGEPERVALAEFYQQCVELQAAVAAPADAPAFQSWLGGVRAVIEAFAARCLGGWFTMVPPDAYLNLATLFHSLVVHLSYHPRYGAATASPPDAPPRPASMEHPGDREHWLFSPDIMNVAWFTDLAVHNPGLHPYECHIEGKDALNLKGRLPDWERALLDHAKLRDLLAGVPGKRHLVSIYTGVHAVDSWEKRPGLDITPLIAALSQGKMERAGHDPRPGQPWGGLQHGRALLVRRGRSGWELVLIGMHPCADQARACRTGQAEEGMLPFGTQQVVAAAAAVIAPACPFPPPERMPKLFIDGSHGRSVRQNCLGCRFYLNVQRVEAGQAVQLLGPGPCYGECALRGLLGLSKTQYTRLERACRAGRFSATEMAWVLWSGALPHGTHMLHGCVATTAMHGCWCSWLSTHPQ